MIGSSHIRRWPRTLFPPNLKIVKIETPTSIVETAGKGNQIDIPVPQSSYSVAIIAGGGNDIGKHARHEILTSITRIAAILKNKNIIPIIVPIINRERSWHCSKAFFNKERQAINKRLRKYFSGTTKPVLNIPQYLPLQKDGVHLTLNSYKILSNHTLIHINKLPAQTHKFPPMDFPNLIKTKIKYEIHTEKDSLYETKTEFIKIL